MAPIGEHAVQSTFYENCSDCDSDDTDDGGSPVGTIQLSNLHNVSVIYLHNNKCCAAHVKELILHS